MICCNSVASQRCILVPIVKRWSPKPPDADAWWGNDRRIDQCVRRTASKKAGMTGPRRRTTSCSSQRRVTSDQKPIDLLLQSVDANNSKGMATDRLYGLTRRGDLSSRRRLVAQRPTSAETDIDP